MNSNYRDKMAYTTAVKVSEELNGYTLNSTTTPTSSTVDGWIAETDAEINLRRGTVWSSTTASSEIHDYDGGGVLRTYNVPIISVTEVLAESNGINAQTAGWQTLNEGRLINQDFIVYGDQGEIHFHGTQLPLAGYQNMCVSYTYGRTTTPSDITHLATLMAARRVIHTIVSGSATTEGGTVSVGTISVGDPTDFGNKRLKQLDEDIDYLFRKIGQMKTYRIDKRYD